MKAGPTKYGVLVLCGVAAVACGSGGTGPTTTGAPAVIAKTSGDGQHGLVSQSPPQQLAVTVRDVNSTPVPGVDVSWTVTSGGGSLATASSATDASGVARNSITFGASIGPTTVLAAAAGVASTVTFTVTANLPLSILAGGNNVPERYGSDLWIANGYAYTGTWGGIPRIATGNALKVWQLDVTGAPTLVDSIITSSINTVSDVQVSPDGQWLVFSTEGGTNKGLWVYSLTNPALPAFAASFLSPANSGGIHTATLAVIGGTLYAFAAQDPSVPALQIFDLSQVGTGTITLVKEVPIAPNYGIHDTFVRDGLAFVCAWNTGVMIYDVGDGIEGGTPASPQLISTLATAGGEVHNAWWFKNPITNEAKYLFIGQEGPGSIGASSNGDIHVVDVSNLSAPVEVAFYHVNGAGTHNFWMDESAQILYAAYYNGGVLALDVSGTLSGDLTGRAISRIQPGGAGNTYVWGVQLYQGSLYALDMLSGFWQLKPPQ